ncbi:ATP-binding protein [Streptomyces sp. NA04227]|uniref:ATP-binding protein n=1 Tax=Streptomyces sp. NA04227 TaxID=2742136 RepID=UPI0020CA5BB9|nr:ATP-binding protein [Streptomyces sp. NA04227]
MRSAGDSVPVEGDFGQWYMQFTTSVKAVALARHQSEKTLRAWGYGQCDTDRIVLAVSELATNAVRHGRVRDRLFEVRLTEELDGLLLEVSDASERVPRPVCAGEDDESGRGLALVAALAEDFGHHPRVPIGKTVWARFRTEAAVRGPEGRDPRS